MNSATIRELVAEALELDRTQEVDGKKTVLPKKPVGWMPHGKRHRIIRIIEIIGEEAAL